jgi:hypothetical protein
MAFMKNIVFFYFFTYSFLLHAQWNEKDTTSNLFDFNTDEFYFKVYGMHLYYCGLMPDNSTWKYDYYKRKDRSDLIYFTAKNLIDSTSIRGFYRLQDNILPPDKDYVFCWAPDLFWFYFDKEERLVKEIFYNDGKEIEPKKFKLNDVGE